MFLFEIFQLQYPLHPKSEELKIWRNTYPKKEKKFVHDSLDEVVPESDFEESGKSQTPPRDIDMGIPSPTRGSPVKSNLEETEGPGGFVKTSNMDTTTNLGDHSKISTPEKTIVIPSEVSRTELVSEEFRTSGITANISHMDVNVNMGEGVSTNESKGTSTIIISSSFDTSTVDTNVSLPPFHTSISTTLPPSIQSPTFENILNQHITSLFPSQSTEGPKTVQEDETTEDGEFMGSFADIEFDPEEENITNRMLMSGKQSKILNRKLNSVLQLQANAGGQNYVTGIEVDVMLKAQ